MKKKAFVACMSHETNSFSPIPTTVESFKDAYYFEPTEEAYPEFLKNIMGIGRIISTFEKLDSALPWVRSLLLAPPARLTGRIMSICGVKSCLI